MNTAEELLRKNLLQIDETDPDFSELETILNIFNSDQHITLYVAYKQDIQIGFSGMKFIRIDLNFPQTKKYPHTVSSTKTNKLTEFYFKKDILEFVKKYL